MSEAAKIVAEDFISSTRKLSARFGRTAQFLMTSGLSVSSRNRFRSGRSQAGASSRFSAASVSESSGPSAKVKLI